MKEHEYWDEIRSLDDEFIQLIKGGEITDSEDAYRWLHETIGGHEYVIYTHHAQALLAISPNDGAMIEDFGSDGVVTDGCLNWNALAFCAMKRDLMDRITMPDFDDEEEMAGLRGEEVEAE